MYIKSLALIIITFVVAVLGASYLALNRQPSTTSTEAQTPQTCSAPGAIFWNGSQCPKGFVDSGQKSQVQNGDSQTVGMCCVPVSSPTLTPPADPTPTPFCPDCDFYNADLLDGACDAQPKTLSCAAGCDAQCNFEIQLPNGSCSRCPNAVVPGAGNTIILQPTGPATGIGIYNGGILVGGYSPLHAGQTHRFSQPGVYRLRLTCQTTSPNGQTSVKVCQKQLPVLCEDDTCKTTPTPTQPVPTKTTPSLTPTPASCFVPQPTLSFECDDACQKLSGLQK